MRYAIVVQSEPEPTATAPERRRVSAMFRARVLLVTLLALALALLAVAVGVTVSSARQAETQANARLTAGLKMLGELYATRRAQTTLSGQRLAADAALTKAALAGNTRAVTQQLAASISPDEGHFAIVLAASGELMGLAGDSVAASSLDALAERVGQGQASASQLVDLAGTTYLIAVTPAARSRLFVVNGFAAERAIAGRLAGVTGLSVGLRTRNEAFGSHFEAPAQNYLAATSVVIDAIGEIELVADLGVGREAGLAGHRLVRNRVFALAGAGFGICALLLSFVLARLVRRQLEEPLDGLREGFRRAMGGDYTTPVLAQSDSPYRPMMRAFNELQNKVSERESRIVHHAQYDTLTGLTNRSVVDERIKVAVAKAQRNGTAVAAIALDLSRFNEINGTLGHEVGDEVLKEVARRLASNTRVSDTVARVGGDEFFVLLEDADEKLAVHLAEFLASSLEAPIRMDEHEVRLTIFAGLALYPTHCETLEALRRMANIALMTAKEKRNKVVVYEPGQDERQLRELAIIHDLPSAIRNNELTLQYQPKIDVETQTVERVEALARWRHPQLGFIPPDEFIALLEKAGKINQLTTWVFKEAIRQSRAWADAGYDLGVAVNISANDLSDEGLPERVHTLLRHYLVEPSRIAIEVTESAVIKDPERSVAILKQFRKVGIKVALDDFGTGQTSLALLKQMPLSEIKIDKSFVQKLRADSGDAIIVKSIIDLGHNMGLLVTAEGVESNYTWNLLNSYGCDLVQGYLVSAALTADELKEWYLRLQDRHVTKLDYSFVAERSA